MMKEKLEVHLECGIALCESKKLTCTNIYEDLDISQSKSALLLYIIGLKITSNTCLYIPRQVVVMKTVQKFTAYVSLQTTPAKI